MESNAPLMTLDVTRHHNTRQQRNVPESTASIASRGREVSLINFFEQGWSDVSESLVFRAKGTAIKKVRQRERTTTNAH